MRFDSQRSVNTKRNRREEYRTEHDSTNKFALERFHIDKQNRLGERFQ